MQKLNNAYKSKFKENDWYNELMKYDIWYNVNASPDSYNGNLKGSNNAAVRFTTKQCIVCKIRFDGNGNNQVQLPKWFDRLPMKVFLCRKHKPEYKKWYRENKKIMKKVFNTYLIGPEHEESIKYWYNKEKKWTNQKKLI
tara:strand:- start:3593 stop:4012 length:420 start_codon:yes stop_codon:yes gene_type:complete